ncbi:VOC family protein [Catelliglobosispora koreensis]
MRQLAFQRAREWRPPVWRDPERGQQLHVDILVDDIEVAEQAVLALGARRAPGETDAEGFRVYLDPAGHPFCFTFHGLGT